MGENEDQRIRKTRKGKIKVKRAPTTFWQIQIRSKIKKVGKLKFGYLGRDIRRGKGIRRVRIRLRD
jgi:hypothetical protein